MCSSASEVGAPVIQGIENPLFFKENTRMFYGDAKASMDDLLRELD